MKEKIVGVIESVLELTPDQAQNIGMDDDLIAFGLDSLNSIEVVVNMESEFDIQIEDEDLLLSNISTINLLQKLVEKYID